MEIFRNSTKDLVNARGGVFALGNFDGVHLGHKEIISKAISIGKKNNIPYLVDQHLLDKKNA